MKQSERQLMRSQRTKNEIKSYSARKDRKNKKLMIDNQMSIDDF